MDGGVGPRLGDFLNSSLATWVLGLAELVGDGQDGEEEEEEEPLSPRGQFLHLSDGVLLHRVMGLIAPSSRGGGPWLTRARGTPGARRVESLSRLRSRLRDFYQEELQLLILTPPPDLQILGFDPLSDEAVEELEGILKLMLGASVQCEHRELFIRHIQGLSLEIQSELAATIQEVTQPGGGAVLAMDGPELVELERAQLELRLRSLMGALGRLVRERERAAQRLAELLLEQEAPAPQGPPRIPQDEPPHHLALQLADTKAQLRRLRQELEEKAEELLDSQGEVQGLEAEIRRLRQEAQALSGAARRAGLYREEAEALRERAGRLPRVQEELRRCRERLQALEACKGQLEEERALSGALEAARALLEGQLETARERCARLHEAQRENLLLRARLGEAHAELDSTRQQLDHLLEENVELEVELRQSLKTPLSPAGEVPSPAWTPSLQEEVREAEIGQLRNLERENRELRARLWGLQGQPPSQTPWPEVGNEEGGLPQASEPPEKDQPIQRRDPPTKETSGIANPPGAPLQTLVEARRREAESREPEGRRQEAECTGSEAGRQKAESLELEARREDAESREMEAQTQEAEPPEPEGRGREAESQELEGRRREADSQEPESEARAEQKLVREAGAWEGVREATGQQLKKEALEGEEDKEAGVEQEREAQNGEQKSSEPRPKGQGGEVVREREPQGERVEAPAADREAGELKHWKRRTMRWEKRLEEEARCQGRRMERPEGEAGSWEQEREVLQVEAELLRRELEALERERVALRREVEAGERRQEALKEEREALREEQGAQARKLEALERELEALKGDQKALQGELEAQGRRLEARAAEAALLGEQLARVRRAEAEAQAEVEAGARERAGLREALETAGRELEAAGREREALGETLGAAGRERRQWEREGLRLRARAQEAEERLRAMESQGREWREEAERQRTESQALRQELQGALAQGQELQARLEELQGTLQRDNQGQEQRLREQEDRHHRACEALEQRLKGELGAVLATKDQALATLSSRAQELERELLLLQQGPQGLTLALSRGGGDAQESPSGRLIEVERNNAALAAEKAALLAQLRQLEGQVATLQAQALDTQQQQQRTQANTSQLQAEKAVLEAQGRELRERVEALEEEVRGSRRAREEAQGQQRALLRDHEALGRLQRRQEAELEALLGRHRELKADIRLLELEHKELQGRYEQLQVQRTQVDAQEASLRAERERLAQDGQRQRGLEEALQRLQGEHDRAQLLLAEASRERGELQGERGELRSRVARLELERAQLEAQAQTLREVNQKLDLSVCKLTTQCQLLTDLRAAQEEENRQLLAEVQALSRENRGLMEQSLESRDHLHREQREYVDQLNALRREKQKLVEKIMDQYRVLEPSPLARPKKGSWLADKVKRLMRHRREGGGPGGLHPWAEGVGGSTESLSSSGDLDLAEGPGSGSPPPMRRAQSSWSLRDEAVTGGQRRKLSSRLPVVRGSESFSPGDSPRQRFRQRRPSPLGTAPGSRPKVAATGWDGVPEAPEETGEDTSLEGHTELQQKPPLTSSLSQ
ncbi:LOW QUALITY PROTEIN: coiled-coil domain-containing protein 88B [Tachyglossus aculeatus]|uniref:LOW QUALITY PROTEIN: coiled-coil domain-containing protein 88B n=1 Tax=Tachyglossus aculeatus TaxID=9261 RepID=UPI0018F7C082|nr:LOW QUALITY PROTEIN: coiled-coil domain-containing protein 88B [Tachyglossus aculeatus]